MEQGVPISTEYFRQYRATLGFTSQNAAKRFFQAQDLNSPIDLGLLAKLNIRLKEIAVKINGILDESIRRDSMADFNKLFVDHVFEVLKDNEILPRLNNQGRRPEQVYFSWMRGYIISGLFTKALSSMFDVDQSAVKTIGDDDLLSIDTFKRTPKADLQVTNPEGFNFRIEMQSGFTGINDIKEHKVREARRVLSESGIRTLVVHLDLYNGQAAFVRIDSISAGDVHWITRQQMEGQSVFNIDQNSFRWKIIDPPIKFQDPVSN